MVANAEGASATFVTQIGTKGMCDGTQPSGNPNPFSSCGETNDLNTSHTLLNEPPDMAVDPLTGSGHRDAGKRLHCRRLRQPPHRRLHDG